MVASMSFLKVASMAFLFMISLLFIKIQLQKTVSLKTVEQIVIEPNCGCRKMGGLGGAGIFMLNIVLFYASERK